MQLQGSSYSNESLTCSINSLVCTESAVLAPPAFDPPCSHVITASRLDLHFRVHVDKSGLLHFQHYFYISHVENLEKRKLAYFYPKLWASLGKNRH